MFAIAAAATSAGAAGLSSEPLAQPSPAGSVQAAGPVDLAGPDLAVGVGPAGPAVVQVAGREAIAGVGGLVCPGLAEARLAIVAVELRGAEMFEEVEVYHFGEGRAGTVGLHPGLHACSVVALTRAVEYAGPAGHYSPGAAGLGGLAEGRRAAVAVAYSGVGRVAFAAEGASN